ncbi:MAG: thymidylate synthase [Clostridiales bacterium]|nr:thymidylate synthase [Clostridiales bacterium]
MKEFFIEGRTLPEAYHKALQTLHNLGELADCPDYEQMQKECTMTVRVEAPTAEPRISKLLICGPKELRQYELEMLDGILDFVIGKADHLWEYTYHQRYAHQLGFVIADLKRELFSRRAIMSLRDFEVDSANSHPACLQSIQYFIRDGKLDCCVLFRSNDLPEAFFMNAFALIRLQEKVAAELGVPIGSYSHRSNSMHAYEKNFALIEGYVRKIEAEPADELVYDYEGFFKDMMAEHDGEIAEMVAKKKEQYGA